MYIPDAAPTPAARALALCVMQPTVSGSDAQAFRRLHALLRSLFPTLFSLCQSETLGGGALLLRLPGRQTARPALFLAHLDTVSPGESERWTHPPFGGEIEGGYLYGRGAADMKGHLVALLSAAEALVTEGWRPAGDVWFAFSCDEETRGGSMEAMARLLAGRGVRPAFVLDEGGFVARPFDCVSEPVACVGVAEKGRLLFSLRCGEAGGLDLLARAAARLSRLRPRPRLCAPLSEAMLPALSPALPRPLRLCLRHTRLLRPPLLHALRRTAAGRALTETQLTLYQLSGDALRRETPLMRYSASVLPGDSAQSLLRRVQKRLSRAPIRLTVECLEEPSAVAPAAGSSWEALSTAIQVHFPGVPIVPSLLPGGTDGRRMEALCPAVYRFSPFLLEQGEMARIHGYDERLSLENLSRGVSFFRQMLQA